MRATILTVLLLTGCASNTPQQARTWARIDACKAQMPPQCQITRVEPDGRYHALCAGTMAMLDDFQRCMQAQR